jgi:predicted NBD/HSP70 family sugar kinase
VGERLKKAWSLALGFALLAVLLYGAYALITAALKALGEANPQVAAAIAAAAATLIVAVVTVVGGKMLERQAAVAKELRDKKSPVYEDLLKFMFRVLTATQQGKPVTPEEMVTSLADFTQRLMVWGSDPVVLAWVRFRQSAGGDGKQLLLAVENVISAIRRDLGHKNANFTPGDLLSLFVFDAKQVIEGESPSAEPGAAVDPPKAAGH